MSGSTPTYRRKHHPLKWWVLAEEMHESWIFDTYVRLRDRVESISPRGSWLRKDTTPWNESNIEYIETKLSLGRRYVCVLCFGGPKTVEGRHIGITTVLPLSGPGSNFCYGELQAIGSGFSDTICPLTTLGLADLYSTNLWLVSFFCEDFHQFNLPN